ncbi:hypothetical protein [Woodsholea maritima]|uniref:hypothetical protein n=1 Tax=Woodsholea maritima TaxID=240237 RepID=UPI000365B012|nr:hypothetical protein [Woodsholea maritima]
MTQTFSDPDLAYLRRMAEAGERAPLLGGRFSLWWGALASLTLLAHWLIETQRLAYPYESVGLLWLGFGVIGTIGSAALGLTIKNKPGTGSAGNRVQGAIWSASVFVIFAFAIGASLTYGLGNAPKIIFNIIPLMAFSVYGINFYTVGVMAQRPWLYGFSALSCLCVIAGWVLIASPGFYLLCAAATFSLAVLPGIIHLTQERPTIA